MIFKILLKNWKGILWAIFWLLFIFLVLFLGYTAYKNTWKKIAFAHKEVKVLVISAKSDSLELEAFYKSDALQKATIFDDSLNYYSKELDYQLLTKKLTSRAVYAEKLLSEFEESGACQYQVEKVTGSWPNKKRSLVWETRPCED
jgi:hypothetical protein